MIRFAAIGLGFVLIASTDFELRVEGVDGPICAKSREVCEAARSAIKFGRWSLGVLPEVATGCVPMPDCFSADSDVIHGFNDPVTRARR